MQLPLYPQELPNPLREGYQSEYGDGRYRTPGEAGNPNFRSRYSAVPDRFNISTILVTRLYGIFNRFLIEDVKRAAEPFVIANHIENRMPLLDDEGTILLDSDGRPLLITSLRVAWFEQMPVIQSRGIDWTISFSVMVMP